MKKIFFAVCLFYFFSNGVQAQVFNPKFFCFADAFSGSHPYKNDPEYQAKLMKDIGFDGVEVGFGNSEQMDKKIEAMDKQDLQVFMIWARIDLDTEQHFDHKLFEFFPKVKDKGVTIWFHIFSKKFTASDPAGDAICVPILQELADSAAKYGVRIALYPHQSDWLIKVGHAVRLTQKANRRNIGAVFNLCHYLKLEERDQLDIELAKSCPYLFAVSINGADDGATNEMEWDRLIQPLGKGSFDVLKVLKILKKNNYKGPVGLQCYQIPGKPEDYLKTSMAAWKKYMKKL